MGIVKFLIAISLLNVSLVSCSRILVLFYHHGASHFYSYYPLFDELAKRGHNVTVVSYAHVKNTHQNYNEILLGDMPLINATITYDTMLPLDRSFYTMQAEQLELYKYAEMERELALKSPAIDRILEAHHDQKFDIVLMEKFISDFYLGLVYKLNVPFIGFSTCSLPSYYYDEVDLPDLPSVVPFAFSEYTFEMNLYERTINWLVTKSWKLFYRIFQMRDNQELRKRFGDDIPDVAEIAKNISLMLVNQHYSFSGPKPLSTQLIEVSGIHIQPEKPLPEKLKQILDNAKNGALVVSWGGNVNSSSMPDHIREGMIKGFAKLPLQVIWKWEDDSIQKKLSKNVHTVKWLPQRDILCHPNVKAFWTHGGNLGTIESVYCGKPMIITPFYGDQFLNAAALGHRGMGVRINLHDITADEIYDAVQKMLDPKVFAAAQKVSYEHNHRLQSPLETAVWWVEHIIKTKGFELGKIHTADMSWFTYYSIDAITLCVVSFMALIYVSKWLIVQLIRCCCRCVGTKNTHDPLKKNN